MSADEAGILKSTSRKDIGCLSWQIDRKGTEKGTSVYTNMSGNNARVV